MGWVYLLGGIVCGFLFFSIQEGNRINQPEYYLKK